ncbi:hypothetical protein LZZ85_27405 [Terrimonas sp. NA20]|uniref:Uncharacterized protein n=1 Tax=Terrimonas ginsenosidimutans TaxID=2908004 RepID=A0ABS9L0F7_9BACT|nr:hypothetical protein [Terrimonas ginsenosidimutans]MCG2618061.1 hypothetical protein [Terrimonas ginsenosidimutans]
MPNRCILILLSILLCVYANAQHDTSSLVSLDYIEQAGKKAGQLEEKLDRASAKLLSSLFKQEAKLQRKLAKKDSAAASRIFADKDAAYQQLQNKLSVGSLKPPYIASLDTLSSSLKFLQLQPKLLNATGDVSQKLQQSLSKVNGLESQFGKAEEIKQFLKQRKQYLRQQLENTGLAKELKAFNKQAYYYSAQVNEYKQVLKDHKKAEKKALELLSKTSVFKEFMRKNSMLASLFRLPGDPNDPQAAASLAGLQTRSQVNNLVQQQISAGGPNAQAQFSQNMQEAQSQLNALKDKLHKLGGGSSDELDMPEGFKPNKQKTKTFLQRIEYGLTMQSQRSNGFFPVTSDLALTVGYKLNDNSIIGVGGGYKIGWGKSINHIRITHEGVSLRSFVDVRLKGSFWLTGGYEQHYREGFKRIAELKDRSGWQESGLIGLSKVVDMRSKLLKKTKVQLLWDFLSYGKSPRPAAILFRIGYTF